MASVRDFTKVTISKICRIGSFLAVWLFCRLEVSM